MCCEGVAAFDVLNALGCGLVLGGSDQNVDVVGHDDEAVELEAAFVAVLKECLDEAFGVGCDLEVPVPLEGCDGNGVGIQRLTDGGH